MVNYTMETDAPKNYIYAIIKIPVEVLSNGSINALQEYASIEFAPCDGLPENPIIQNINFSNFFSKIDQKEPIIKNNIEPKKESDPKPIISNDEILAYRTTIPYKQSQNMVQLCNLYILAKHLLC